MSALTPKADMCGATRHVRFLPKADIRSFDEHVHAAQKCFRNRQAYGLRSLEIDYQLVLRGLLYRYVLWCLALKNFLHQLRTVPNRGRAIGPE